MMFEIVERQEDGLFIVLAIVSEPSELPAQLESLRPAWPKAFIRKREAAPAPNGEIDPLDAAWRAREASRLADGTYRSVPWSLAPFAKVDHYAHWSLSEPGMVAFTPTAEHGRAGRQLRVKISRYLTHWLGLSDKIARHWAGEFEALFPAVKFAATAEEIQHVYESGPSSCMSHPTSDYDTNGVHPTTVYAAGDLAVAYLVEDNRIVARAVAWPERKIRTRIYAHSSEYSNRLADALHELGYRIDDLDGARLARIDCDNDNYVMPYLDGTKNVSDRGDYFVIEPNGDYCATQTNGLLYELTRCHNCNDPIGEDDCYPDPNGNDSLCEHCYYELYTSCSRCDDTISIDDAISVNDGLWCEYCVDNHSTLCDHCNERTTNDSETVDGETWCDTCVQESATWCDECDGYFSNARDHNHNENNEREPSSRVEDERQGELAI